MNFTYFGHSCFNVIINGKNIMFDPFITPKGLAITIIDAYAIKGAYIQLRHGHQDHIANVLLHKPAQK
ncbi:MAG: MBL fold metallo-hydrolase [Bacteroidota bacterium]